ncbi:WecB/TagA/CpsF family glycosyltransferase [Granulicella arctica]|uniref:WecB/TagA/CpsF family glycosyltransferase n=1 Tax=Granulicella arctica TaxID=940613 RepID=UPI0021DFDDB1|nr:WecB/TagA/CpsF family glycosyltransferase [Granulicella arctica]
MILCTEDKKANVLGVSIDAVDMEGALTRLAYSLRHRLKGYVCLVGVHGVMECKRNPVLANIINNASLTAPDGMPTVWVGRHQGHAGMRRVTGPDLMLEVISREEFRGYSHFLCGGKEGIAVELRAQLEKRFPSVKVVGTFMPPFEAMSLAQEEAFVSSVNLLRPDIVWVGISTPKQEHFMSRYLPLLDTTLMFAVGAAFDFHTGRIADCSEWIKQAGFQWLHRFFQDPKHLWKRYLMNVPAFLFHISLQLTGFKSYEANRMLEQGRKTHTSEGVGVGSARP